MYGERGAPIGFVAPAVVGKTEVKLDGDFDQPEHVERAAHAQITGQHRSELRRIFLALERKIDTGHYVHLATGDADVERRGRPEFERDFEFLHAGGVELEVEKTAAAEDRDCE